MILLAPMMFYYQMALHTGSDVGLLYSCIFYFLLSTQLKLNHVSTNEMKTKFQSIPRLLF